MGKCRECPLVQGSPTGLQHTLRMSVARLLNSVLMFPSIDATGALAIPAELTSPRRRRVKGTIDRRTHPVFGGQACRDRASQRAASVPQSCLTTLSAPPTQRCVPRAPQHGYSAVSMFDPSIQAHYNLDLELRSSNACCQSPRCVWTNWYRVCSRRWGSTEPRSDAPRDLKVAKGRHNA